MSTILIIEDEQTLARVLQSYLEREGFQVITANRGDTGYDMILTRDVDLVLLDLNLPGMDGMDIAREIVKQRNTPIIIITARVEEFDKLKGLETGADDYITKPFSPREVVARVKTVLRRVNRTVDENLKVENGFIQIDVNAHTVKKAGRLIELTPSEFEILVLLARNAGRVYTRYQLLEAIQGQSFEGYERTIDAHIKNLRAKIEDDAKNPVLIRTVFGIGYKFLADEE